MNLFLTFAFLFCLGSLIGWVIELFFRRFFSAKKWLNPGFLVGPYLPLYGFGLCLLYLLASIDLSFLSNKVVRTVVLILLMGLAMTVIEYIAGKIFIVGMHVKLWDYSDRWLNFQGIICPEFSFYWTVLGAVYYFAIHPFITGAVSWLFSNLAFSFLVGMFFGIFLIDVAYSMNLMARIRAFAKEYEITVKLEELKKSISERVEGNRFSRFVFAFRGSRPLKEHLHEYREQWKEYTDKLMKKAKKKLEKK